MLQEWEDITGVVRVKASALAVLASKARPPDLGRLTNQASNNDQQKRQLIRLMKRARACKAHLMILIFCLNIKIIAN